MNLIPHIERDPCELTAPGHRGNNRSQSQVSRMPVFERLSLPRPLKRSVSSTPRQAANKSRKQKQCVILLTFLTLGQNRMDTFSC